MIVRDLMAACRKLVEVGKTIVLVEQNLAATLILAQRAYIINNGHIVHEGRPASSRTIPRCCVGICYWHVAAVTELV